MISYSPLVETLKKKKVGILELGEKISHKDLRYVLNSGRYLSLGTVDKICSVLECDVKDVCTYMPGPQKIRNRKKREFVVIDWDEFDRFKDRSDIQLSSDLGMSSNYISTMRSRKTIGKERVCRVCDELGISIDDIIQK